MGRKRKFNITGLCIKELHYMVDTTQKIDQIIQDFIKTDSYFTINRARQYGKTTTLRLLERALCQQYIIIRISFEGKEEYFSSLQALAGGLCFSFQKSLQNKYPDYAEIFQNAININYPMRDLSERISLFCQRASQGTILMIDEVDKAANHQTFLSFLGILREMFLNKMDFQAPAFNSVILVGVHDIKNLKTKIRPGEKHMYNSPWNIAADFEVDMSFSAKDISTMLREYEKDHCTGMNISQVSQTLYEYTSGYPFLVSYICKILDEQLSQKEEFSKENIVWTKEGISEAVKEVMKKSNSLFDDMKKQLADYPELHHMLHAILFNGRVFPYNPDSQIIDIGVMLGFLKEKDGQVWVANRIFETRLYNYFISEEMIDAATKSQPGYDKNQFIQNGFLDMDQVMYKFHEYFTAIYRENDVKFIEENGRRLFLLYLKPIINGIGNYYIEAQTRDMTRTDVVIDYRGQQFVIEMKIYHGNEYNHRGEKQLIDYLNYYHLDKGYLLSFNFNQKKKTGIRTIRLNGKELLEVVV